MMRQAPRAGRPAAIVLSLEATGLATVRGLAALGVDVYAFVFDRWAPVRFSRHARKIPFYGRRHDVAGLLEAIRDLSSRLGERPVVLPTCDEHALMLAEHGERLRGVCRFSQTGFADLQDLVRKDRLYAIAAGCGVNVVPSIANASTESIAAWSADNPGPYLLKPHFVGADGCRLATKNRGARDRGELLDALSEIGTASLIVQRRLAGGDGEIYDVYGLRDAAGRIRTMASHRRIRQFAPNLGTTSYGAIPSGLGAADDERMFEHTTKLLEATRFHGIFGIEWLRETSTGRFYVLDFNARPFLSIGHLFDCGVNLPGLAYRELIGEDLSGEPPLPPVRPRLWVNLLPDIRTHLEGTSAQHLPHGPWIRSVLAASSHAYWDWRDPGPGIKRAGEIAWSLLRFTSKRLFRSPRGRRRAQ